MKKSLPTYFNSPQQQLNKKSGETVEIIKSDLIFETPNYKVRIGEYKDINVASQKLEGIRRLYPGSFIIKLSEL